jgi:peptidoglycan hydrolase-like protein with peptidoglycan-binding domain
MNRFTRGFGIAACTSAAAGMLVAGAAFQAGAATAAPATVAAAVRTGAPAQAAAAAYTAPKRTLHEGMGGSDVKALQQRLAALKYYAGGADGQFGPNTLEAVWAFQEVQGIGVDGIVGPVTAKSLVHPKAYAPRYPHGGATRVEVNLTKRVLVLYRSNAVALISHVSSGGGYRYCSPNGCSYAITPTGSYHTTTYMPGWVTVPLGKMYNPVFFIGTTYAIHGDTDVPLGPVSHGCVRIPMDIAAFFHTLVSSHGTPVFVFR